MNITPSQEQIYATLPKVANDEIDLRQVAGAISRQRRFIAVVTSAFLVISGVYAFTRKPVDV